MVRYSLAVARQAYREGNVEKSLAHFLAILKFYPGKAAALESEFLDVLEMFCIKYDSSEYILLVEDRLEMAMAFYGSSVRLKIMYAHHLVRSKSYEQAAVQFSSALSLDPNNGEARRGLHDLRSYFVSQWHFKMLNDVGRNLSYKKAIQCAVDTRRVSSVLDIGCGTGLLSMMASEAGVKTVYACECNSMMAQIAKEVVKNNDLQDSIAIFAEHSMDLKVGKEVSSPVDLVVTELMDDGLFGESIVSTLLDAKDRLLNKDGLIIPSKASVWGMLVESEAIRSDHVFERQDLPCDMRFPTCVLSSVCAFEKAVSSEVSEAEPYTSEKMDNYASCRWLSDPFLLDEIDFNSESDLIAHTCGIQRTITVQLKANGRLDAIVCWFRVNLFGDIEISSHPANKTSWDQAVFPLYMNDTMQNGSEVRVRCIISNNVLRCQIVPIDAKVQTSALVCPSSLVALLNDMVLLNSYRLFMQSTIGAGVLRHSAILDVTDNPLIALLATKLFGAEVWSQCKPQCIEMFEHQSSTCSNGSVVLFGKVEDVVDVAPCTLLLCCPVSSGGDLRRNALKQVWYSRANLEITQVIPECMEVHCILVECEQLEDYTYLVNDDRTLGFKVREQINPYRTLVQRELKLNQLVYTPLSSPFRLMTIDLQEPLDNLNENAPGFIKQYATTVVPTTREGIFNAVVFWFNLKCPSLTSVCFNTSESANHFKVAAALIKRTTVAKNALIEVCAQLDNGILTFYPNF